MYTVHCNLPSTHKSYLHSTSHLDDGNFMVYRKPTPNYNLGDGIGWFKGNTQGLHGLVLLLLLLLRMHCTGYLIGLVLPDNSR